MRSKPNRVSIIAFNIFLSKHCDEHSLRKVGKKHEKPYIFREFWQFLSFEKLNYLLKQQGYVLCKSAQFSMKTLKALSRLRIIQTYTQRRTEWSV